MMLPLLFLLIMIGLAIRSVLPQHLDQLLPIEEDEKAGAWLPQNQEHKEDNDEAWDDDLFEKSFEGIFDEIDWDDIDLGEDFLEGVLDYWNVLDDASEGLPPVIGAKSFGATPESKRRLEELGFGEENLNVGEADPAAVDGKTVQDEECQENNNA